MHEEFFKQGERPIESYIVPQSQSIKYPNLEVFSYLVFVALLVGAAIASALWAK